MRTSAAFIFALGEGSRNQSGLQGDRIVRVSYKSEDPDFVSKPSVIRGHLILFAMHWSSF